MSQKSDQQLLREYAGERSERAFAELVRRHVDMVHSAARRMVADEQLAEDIAQAVFVALAQNAGRVAGHPVLAGWLHLTTRNLAANAIRTAMRRHAREEEALVMNELLSHEENGAWEEIAPLLDSALGELDQDDRDAVLLRYFERKTAREIAVSLGVSYEAAQKRTARAVERLREILQRRGAGIGAGALAVMLAEKSVEAAPAFLAAKILAASGIAAALAPASTTILSAKILVMTTTQKIIVGAAIVLAVGGGIYKTRNVTAHPASARLPKPPPYKFQPRWTPEEQQRREASRAASAQRPGATAPKVVLRNGTAAMPFTATRMYQLLKQKEPKLTRAQITPYLNANGRNATSLLAAYRTSGEADLLAEALEKFPDDPQVNFEALLRKDGSEGERRERLDALKKVDPENSMANYLSALDHFKRGENNDVVKDLVAAASKQKFQDYSVEREEGNEEAYASAGYPPGAAKMMANAFLIMPQLPEFVELGKNLVTMADSYGQAGDEDSRRNALQMAVDLGKRFGDPNSGEPLLSQIIGIRIERDALKAMDAGRPYDGTGMTVGARIDQLVQRKEGYHALTQQADGLWEHLSEQDWINYYYQRSQAGEEVALNWLVGGRK